MRLSFLAPFFARRGRSIRRNGHLDKARTNLERSCYHDPDNSAYYAELMSLLSELRDFSRMFDLAFDRSMRHPSPEIGVVLVDLAMQVPDRLEAASIFFEAVYPARFKEFPNLSTSCAKFEPLLDWCRAREYVVSELLAATSVQLPDISDSSANYTSPNILAAMVPGGQSICGWDFVVAPAGEVLDGSGFKKLREACFHFMPHVVSSYNDSVAFIWSKELINVDADALFLSCPPGYHFGHWILDFLPRLVVLRGKIDLPLKIFFPRELPQHHRDTLDLFGIHAEDLIPGEFCRVYRFRSLVVVNGWEFESPSPEIVRFLYSCLGPQRHLLAQTPPHSHIFLERSQTKRGRDIVNSNEFGQILSEFEFTTMRRPDVSVADQNRILADASVVVSAYGSDCLALYQLRPGTHLIVLYMHDVEELAPGESLDLNLARQCGILGIRLHRLFCQPVNEPGRVGYRRNITVDCEQLRKMLRVIAK